MQNEFEKQVQQKLDELKLVPSGPVWQKVEEQIRKKKDRRRRVLWLPLLVLLLTGGVWFGIDQYSSRTAYSTSNEKQKQDFNAAPKKTTDKIKEQKNTLAKNRLPVKRIQTQPAAKPNVEVIKTNSTNSVSGHERTAQKRPSRNPEKEDPVTGKITGENRIGITRDKTVLAGTGAPKEEQQKPDEQESRVEENRKNAMDSSRKNIQNPDLADTPSVKEERIEMNIVKTDSVLRDTASIKKIDVKKRVASKWKFDWVVAAGFSGSKQLDWLNNLFGGGEKSLSTTPNNGPGGSMGGGTYYGPSDIKTGLAFVVGSIAKKKIGRRTFFSTGLRYNYYSNTIQVGNRISQSRIIMDYAVAQYYSNQTGSSSLKPYHNRYHFISLPLAIDWQFLKKLPLTFHSGLSIQYLFQTNALRFDYSTQSYFHNKKAFNSTGLFSEFGFAYSVPMKQRAFTFGPQLQYGLSRLEKGNPTYHLLSYGLKAQWQWSKK